jgi:hypothetical protein
MNRFDELKNLVMSLEADFSKFYEKNNQTAGTRIRKGMQDIKSLAQGIRTQVQDIKNKEEAKKEAPKAKTTKKEDKPKAKAKK